MKTTIREFWKSVNMQEKEIIPTFFKDGATIFWQNTNEEMDVDEYVARTCSAEVERSYEIKQIEETGDHEWTCIVLMSSQALNHEFYSIAFIKVEDDKIARLDEYWSEIGNAPTWKIM